MNIEFLRKRFFIVFFIVVILALIIISLISISLFNNSENIKQNIPPDQGQNLEKIRVIKITPQNNIPFIPNQKQNFKIEFNKQILLNEVKAELKQKNIITDKSSIASLIETIDGNSLLLTTSENILPLSVYMLLIYDKNSNLIFSSQFESDDYKPVIKNNNPALVSYLPYETNSFRLSYYSERNIYYFNFKQDNNSNEALEIQFEKAKQKAIEFIKSKGIDPSMLEIEWKHY